MIKDATYYAELIRKKEVTPEELIDSVVRKAREHQDLHAFTELEPEFSQQLLQTKKSKVSQQPFYGVPFPIKDLGQNREGMAQTSGSRLFKGLKASETNSYMARIEDIGFVPLGVTTAPEFGFKNISDPACYNTAKNVWNKDYHAGGSSGGAASVVASGISPIAGASDGGGSIRIPASFSGLIGMKPSRGRIVTGPSSWRDWQGASVNFALTVSMRDTARLLDLLKPTNQISPFLMPQEHLPEKGRPLKIAVCVDSPIDSFVSDEAKLAVGNMVSLLESMGHSVEAIPYPVDGARLIRSYYKMNGGETANMMAGISQAIGRELTKDDMELMSWTLYQYGLQLSAADYASSFNEWDEATFKMETLFEEYDLFLSPTATGIAPKIDEDLQSDKIREEMTRASELDKEELASLVYDMFEKSLAITPYTQLANLTGQPAISLPTHVTKQEEMPIGVQFMASKGNDQLLIDVGVLIEALGVFILPKAYR